MVKIAKTASVLMLFPPVDLYSHQNGTRTMSTSQAEHDHSLLTDIIARVGQYSEQFLKNIDDFPTGRKGSVVPPDALPADGTGALSALDTFIRKYEQVLVSSTGPRYFGFVTGGVTPAALAGDWLTTVYDQNPQGVEGFGDISAIIEVNTIKMLMELLCLPDEFTGGFVTGATMANFSSLAVARQWVGLQVGKDIAREGLDMNISCLSATPHSSSVKALAMLGLGSSRVVQVKRLGDTESMDVDDLEKQLKALSGAPAIVISSGGTVNTVDFDDMVAIAALKQRYKFWWHIDAAFGGFAACSPKYRYLLNGWEKADSITVDCHKWLNTPYDGGVFLVRKAYSKALVQTFQNSNAPYLGDASEQFAFLNIVPENSRRLRALPAWFSLMAYGKTGYREIIENNIRLGHDFGEMITRGTGFRLLADVKLNVVAFTFSEQNVLQKKVNLALKKLNDRGKVFITPTVIHGCPGFRAAFVNWRTRHKDIEILMNELNEVLFEIKNESSVTADM